MDEHPGTAAPPRITRLMALAIKLDGMQSTVTSTEIAVRARRTSSAAIIRATARPIYIRDSILIYAAEKNEFD